MKAIILAAGRGSRLSPLTDTLPKPLIKIKGRPLLKHILESLPDNINEVIIIVKYLKEKIIKEIGESFNNKKVIYIEQKDFKGTYGALFSAKELIKDEEKFIVLNGDDIFSKKDLEKICDENFAMGVKKDFLESEKYLIIETENNILKNFKNHLTEDLKEKQYLGTGIYVLNNEIFNFDISQIDKEKEIGIPTVLRKILNEKNINIKIVETNSYKKHNTFEDFNY